MEYIFILIVGLIYVAIAWVFLNIGRSISREQRDAANKIADSYANRVSELGISIEQISRYFTGSQKLLADKDRQLNDEKGRWADVAARLAEAEAKFAALEALTGQPKEIWTNLKAMLEGRAVPPPVPTPLPPPQMKF